MVRGNGALSTSPVWPWQAPLGCGVEPSLSSALLHSLCYPSSKYLSAKLICSLCFHGLVWQHLPYGPSLLPTTGSARWAACPGPIAAFMCTAPGPGPSVPSAASAVVSPSSIMNLPTELELFQHPQWVRDMHRDCVAPMLWHAWELTV